MNLLRSKFERRDWLPFLDEFRTFLAADHLYCVNRLWALRIQAT
jgi:hypothetical protein